MSKKLKINIFNWLLYLLVGSLGVLFGMFVVKSRPYLSAINPAAIRGLPGAYVVISGSMEPVIKTGGLVISIPSSIYKTGDVVTFKEPGKDNVLVTHRIVATFFSQSRNDFVFYTKGDANKTVDIGNITRGQILGKAVFGIPYLGYFANSVKDPKMFILFVIVPATVIVYEELKYIKTELEKRLKQLIKKINGAEKNFNSSGSLNKIFVIVPLAAVLILLSKESGSFFSDFKVSSSNALVTGIFPNSTPSPTPVATPSNIANHLVINEVLYNTSSAENISGQGGSNRGEFAEIYNPTNSDINLMGWTLNDNGSSETLSGTIPSQGFLILTGGTEAEFRTVWSSVPNNGTVIFNQASGGEIGNSFANGGDEATLKNGSTVIDAVSWGTDTNGLNPSVSTVASGHSIGRSPNGKDTDTASDFIDKTTPDPGI